MTDTDTKNLESLSEKEIENGKLAYLLPITVVILSDQSEKKQTSVR